MSWEEMNDSLTAILKQAQDAAFERMKSPRDVQSGRSEGRNALAAISLVEGIVRVELVGAKGNPVARLDAILDALETKARHGVAGDYDGNIRLHLTLLAADVYGLRSTLAERAGLPVRVESPSTYDYEYEDSDDDEDKSLGIPESEFPILPTSANPIWRFNGSSRGQRALRFIESLAAARAVVEPFVEVAGAIGQVPQPERTLCCVIEALDLDTWPQAYEHACTKRFSEQRPAPQGGRQAVREAVCAGRVLSEMPPGGGLPRRAKQLYQVPPVSLFIVASNSAAKSFVVKSSAAAEILDASASCDLP